VGVPRDCPIFWVPPIISKKGKATDFKFGGYIFRAYPKKPIKILEKRERGRIRKSPFKILEKRERGRIQGLSNFFGYPLLSEERVKLRTSNFEGTFIGWIGTKATWQMIPPLIRLRHMALYKFDLID